MERKNNPESSERKKLKKDRQTASSLPLLLSFSNSNHPDLKLFCSAQFVAIVAECSSYSISSSVRHISTNHLSSLQPKRQCLIPSGIIVSLTASTRAAKKRPTSVKSTFLCLWYGEILAIIRMNSIRACSSSASARVVSGAPLLSTPPCRLPTSSSSFPLYRSSLSVSKRSIYSSSPRAGLTSSSLFNRNSAATGRISVSSSWSGATSLLNPTQIRKMATEIQKIKVKNPVVELDGDEVCLKQQKKRVLHVPLYVSRLPACSCSSPLALFSSRGEIRGGGEQSASLPIICMRHWTDFLDSLHLAIDMC